jgi:hypothetical protein
MTGKPEVIQGKSCRQSFLKLVGNTIKPVDFEFAKASPKANKSKHGFAGVRYATDLS